MLFRIPKISGRVILKIRNSSAQPSSWCHARWKFGNWNCSILKRLHDIELRNCEEIYFLGNLSLKEGKNSVGLPVLILEFWWRHVKTKNSAYVSAPGHGPGQKEMSGMISSTVTQYCNKPFYSCLLSDPAYEWQRGCRLYGPRCFYHVNCVVVVLTSLYLHKKSKELCIKTKSPAASLPFIGWVTEPQLQNGLLRREDSFKNLRIEQWK